MMNMGLAALAIVLALVAGCAPTPRGVGAWQTGQHPHRFDGKISRTVHCKYLLYLPDGGAGKPAGGRWPLLLFLHGAGERGDDLELVKRHGPPRLIEQGRRLPFIVVSPQCPADEWWQPDVLAALLDDIIMKYPVDPDRIYVTGLSMGGMGTWELALRFPDRFAAIAPICGPTVPFLAGRIRHVPAWVFHGAKDTVVAAQESIAMVEALRRAGADVRLTVYPDAGHDSWTATYANEELYDWLLQHRR